MNQRNVRRIFVGAELVAMLFLAPAVGGQGAPAGPAGITRTYYVAADEVNWDSRSVAPGIFDEMILGVDHT